MGLPRPTNTLLLTGQQSSSSRPIYCRQVKSHRSQSICIGYPYLPPHTFLPVNIPSYAHASSRPRRGIVHTCGRLHDTFLGMGCGCRLLARFGARGNLTQRDPAAAPRAPAVLNGKGVGGVVLGTTKSTWGSWTPPLAELQQHTPRGLQSHSRTTTLNRLWNSTNMVFPSKWQPCACIERVVLGAYCRTSKYKSPAGRRINWNNYTLNRAIQPPWHPLQLTLQPWGLASPEDQSKGNRRGSGVSYRSGCTPPRRPCHYMHNAAQANSHVFNRGWRFFPLTSGASTHPLLPTSITSYPQALSPNLLDYTEQAARSAAVVGRHGSSERRGSENVHRGAPGFVVFMTKETGELVILGESRGCGSSFGPRACGYNMKPVA